MAVKEEHWRTASEACEHLNISENTLLRWIAQRAMPVHRIGRTLRFKFSEIDNWICSGRPAAVTPTAKRKGRRL
jgi:excisionase family DNA binding protein